MAATSNSSSSTGALGKFLNKLSDWKFCPPSNNLWTIQIKLHNSGEDVTNGTIDHSFKKLYQNILNVNAAYDSAYSTSYNVNVKGDSVGESLLKYIETLQDNEIGLFLATDLSFNANSVQVRDQQSQQNIPFSGWLSYGKTVTGRDHNHAGKIKFYGTNWNMNELLIDKWIAAIGQQGLIEGDEVDGIYNIKADIFIKEYATSIPDSTKKGWKHWALRKQIKLTKAFPKSREQYKYSNGEDSSNIVSAGVDFEFENYTIEYEKTDWPKIAVNTNTTAGGQAQQTNMYKNASGLA
jgi:hypothetical protein